MNSLDEGTYSTKRAARISGMSVTMLDYLCRSKLVVPTASKKRGRGCVRLYSFGDVVMLRAITKLLDGGISVSRLRSALIALRKYHPEITRTSLPSSLLVTDGERVFLRESGESLEELSTGQCAFAFIVELKSLRREVVHRIGNRSTRRVSRGRESA